MLKNIVRNFSNIVLINSFKCKILNILESIYLLMFKVKMTLTLMSIRELLLASNVYITVIPPYP